MCSGQCNRVSLNQMSFALHCANRAFQSIMHGWPVLLTKATVCVREQPLQKPGCVLNQCQSSWAKASTRALVAVRCDVQRIVSRLTDALLLTSCSKKGV
jgi:hypothetical protein